MEQPHEFLWRTGRLNADGLPAVGASFDTLRPSAYQDGGYRLRRYSKFAYRRGSGQLRLLPNSGFIQSSELNRFQGGVARTYDEITEETFSAPGFAEMFAAFAQTASLPENTVIEVHQMRIIAKPTGEAAPATPEGIHRDGFDYVGVFTVARRNTQGGELFVWHRPDDAQPLAACLPEAGEYCVLNDRAVWHSASPVGAADSGSAYWDLFVLTVNVEPV
ncbi:2OG-Fe dioxygenase family protein [Neisseria leonii]|uniref:2OG-Fe dioxygenase family protein n=1 Tax=Neisseria leonii TaxID=2995413 RepID=A0A9X4E0U7_9NEIS|nr:2OG-Fe dioxygenase family protein [Neisseria sp. 51.81]MDD9327440.1 2OG-Fe dioxygenase family protein [Neisseria sp. 51.81]